MTLTETIKEIMVQNLEGNDIEIDRYYLENDAIPVSGSVSGLIYYSETEPLAKEYYDEIIELMQEVYGDSIPADSLSLNNMAWFAFEYLKDGLIDEVLEETYGEDYEEDEEEE